MNGPELAVAVGGAPGVSGCAALVKTGAPVQVALSGPKTVKTTVPVGVGPPGAPVTVAVSEIGLPIVTGPSAWVTMVGVAGATTDDSLASLQALVTAV